MDHLPDGLVRVESAAVDGMTEPVKCTLCGSVYDLCTGKVIARYADCTVFLAPCCAAQVDDREHVSLPAFIRL